MQLSRRKFVQSVMAAGATLFLPATLEENAEEVRRIWALGAIPQRRFGDLFLGGYGRGDQVIELWWQGPDRQMLLAHVTPQGRVMPS